MLLPAIIVKSAIIIFHLQIRRCCVLNLSRHQDITGTKEQESRGTTTEVIFESKYKSKFRLNKVSLPESPNPKVAYLFWNLSATVRGIGKQYFYTVSYNGNNLFRINRRMVFVLYLFT